MHRHAFAVRNSHGAIVSLRVQRLSGHSAPITTLAITATHLYSGSSDRSILVWDLDTHALLSRLEGGHEGGITALVAAPVPAADMLFSACEAGYIASWDLCILRQTASLRHSHDGPSRPPDRHQHPITALAVSGNRLFSADDKGVLKAWDACMIGTPRLSLSELQSPSTQAHTHTITAMAATDTHLFSAGMYVKVWDSRTLTLLSKVKMHSGLTTALCLQGGHLFTGSRAIKMWEASALALLHTTSPSPSPSPTRRLKKHSHPVTAIVVSADGRRLYSAAHVIKVTARSCSCQVYTRRSMCENLQHALLSSSCLCLISVACTMCVCVCMFGRSGT